MALKFKLKIRNHGPYGETFFDEKIIYINVARGDILDSIVHERLHERYPMRSEWRIRRMSKELQRKMNLKTLKKIDAIVRKEIL